MRVIRTPARMRAMASALRRRHRTVGLVPTMGALHEGHASLIRASAARYDATIVSIFVNPLQFGPREDFRRYPRPLRQDLALAAASGATAVFIPSVLAMYPPGFCTGLEVGPLAGRWEGRARPGHFRGVATVVLKLFNLVQPTHALFGQKDYQQALIIQQLTRDLQLPLTVRMLPTVREPGGLALSSRNRSLTPGGRRRAAVLSAALRQARARLAAGERRPARIEAQMRRMMQAERGVRVEYAAVVDARTLEPVRAARGRLALLVAARVEGVRLIDNLLVGVS